MFINDLMCKLSKERSARERKEAAQRAAMQVGIAAVVLTAAGIVFMTKAGRHLLERLINKAAQTSDILEENVVKTVSTVKHAGVTAFNDVRDGIEDIQKKAEQIKGDLKDGNQDIADDIQNTISNISDDLKSE